MYVYMYVYNISLSLYIYIHDYTHTRTYLSAPAADSRRENPETYNSSSRNSWSSLLSGECSPLQRTSLCEMFKINMYIYIYMYSVYMNVCIYIYSVYMVCICSVCVYVC